MELYREAAAYTGFGVSDIKKIVRTGPERYKVYQIAKKNGGTRTIAHPSKELKALQYFLLDCLISKLPVHKCASAYVIGRNIRNNAEHHRKSNVILKADFSSFFPSITPFDLFYVMRAAGIKIGVGEKLFIGNVCFWTPTRAADLCLSVGAPSSPAISNAIMYSFDTLVSEFSDNHGLVYTRYADDITISGRSVGDLRVAQRHLRSVVQAMRVPTLVFNEEKWGIFSKGQKRMVTGLVITPDSKVSIGRERKRKISSLVHRYRIGELEDGRIKELQGYIAFAISSEPEFIAALARKYNAETIRDILKGVVSRPQ